MKALALAVLMAAETLVLAGLMIRDGAGASRPRPGYADTVRLAKALRITDLAIWTEARYTRHPSQADGFSAFQDGPAWLDHFPAGLWVRPRRHPALLEAASMAPQ